MPMVRFEQLNAHRLDDGFMVVGESDGDSLKGHVSRTTLRGFCERTIRMLNGIEREEQAASLHPHTCPHAERMCEPPKH